jgi:L-asparaginase
MEIAWGMGMNNQKRVIVINTGGTIAMELDERTDSVQSRDVQPLHSIEPLLNQYAPVEMVDLFNIPSPQITPDMMYTLSQVVSSHLNQEDVSGVVITHGTDTLEETAYYLDLTVADEKPVVVTGAMRSSNELGADGPVNLIQSIRVASDTGSRGRGTLVVFNDEIHAARDVTKTHTSNVATFQSPAYGPVGIVTKRAVTYHQPPMHKGIFAVKPTRPQVPIVKVATGMDPSWLDYLVQKQIDGVVLEAFGAGNVPPSIMPLLETLIQRRIPVVMVSRCYNGYVQDLYGYDGGGKNLRNHGVIFCNGLNGQKARIQLIVMLSAEISFENIAQHF